MIHLISSIDIGRVDRASHVIWKDARIISGPPGSDFGTKSTICRIILSLANKRCMLTSCWNAA